MCLHPSSLGSALGPGELQTHRVQAHCPKGAPVCAARALYSRTSVRALVSWPPSANAPRTRAPLCLGSRRDLPCVHSTQFAATYENYPNGVRVMSANALAGRASQLRSLLRSQAGIVAERPTRQCALRGSPALFEPCGDDAVCKHPAAAAVLVRGAHLCASTLLTVEGRITSLSPNGVRV